jgi:uncharacterized phage protein (TIGR01671 family)
MKNIKFRIWDKAENEFADLFEYEDSVNWFRRYEFWAKIPDSLIIEQFTGLKDKNGKEIYEGDILEFNYYSSIAKGKVVQERSGAWIFRCCNSHNKFHNGFYISAYNKKMKVIGNIHERS